MFHFQSVSWQGTLSIVVAGGQVDDDVVHIEAQIRDVVIGVASDICGDAPEDVVLLDLSEVSDSDADTEFVRFKKSEELMVDGVGLTYAIEVEFRDEVQPWEVHAGFAGMNQLVVHEVLMHLCGPEGEWAAKQMASSASAPDEAPMVVDVVFGPDFFGPMVIVDGIIYV